MTPLCIYHSSCFDGFTAAWVVRKALGAQVEFFPGTYNGPQPSKAQLADRDIVLVDFSYPKNVLLRMAAVAKSVLVLDHHKTAEEALRGIAPPPESPYSSRWAAWLEHAHLEPENKIACLFDMERSGAGLTWDFFWPNHTMPNFLAHVEDRDLWRFKFYATRAVHAYMSSFPFEFEHWDVFNDLRVTELAIGGAAILRKHDRDVAELARTARTWVIAGHTVPVANAPVMYVSDLGHLLAKNAPFAAVYSDTKHGRIISLRSVELGMDVSEIAKAYGGGGHKHAAGFKMKLGWEGDLPTPSKAAPAF